MLSGPRELGRRVQYTDRGDRRRHRCLGLMLVSVLATVVLVVFPAIAGSETSATVTAENVGGFYAEHRWSPAQVTVSTIAGVTISNPTTVAHGVEWISPPSTPNCDSGVPVGTTEAASGTNWKGTCTFTTPGTYTYYCTVHHAAMRGTIVVKEPGTPKAATGIADKNQTTATLRGSINPEGNPTSYYFKYGLDSKLEQKAPGAPQSVGPPDFNEHAVSTSLSGLEPNTPYHVELVAVYGAGVEVDGLEQTFTTPAVTAPTVVTADATVEGEHKATLHGTVDPNGGKTTEYFFEYGMTTAYGAHTASVKVAPADNSPHTAAATIPGGLPSEEELTPGTTYHYRLVASNEVGGLSEGEDRSFTTGSPPPPPKEPPTEPPAKEAPSLIPTPIPTPTPILTPGPIVPGPELAPLVPPFVRSSLKLTAPRHRPSVHGSVSVSSSGGGGRLEVDLIASSASLGKGRHKKSSLTVVGRLVRSSVSAGKASFSISLNAAAKRALHHRHKLTLTVKITLMPTSGSAEVVTKSIVVRS